MWNTDGVTHYLYYKTHVGTRVRGHVPTRLS